MPQQQADVDIEPFRTLSKAFSSYGSIDPLLFSPIVNYLERVCISEGQVLWTSGDAADGLYIIESGVLRARYKFANPTQHFEESMVAGTVAGEMSALSDSPRNATVDGGSAICVVETQQKKYSTSANRRARVVQGAGTAHSEGYVV